MGQIDNNLSLIKSRLNVLDAYYQRNNNHFDFSLFSIRSRIAFYERFIATQSTASTDAVLAELQNHAAAELAVIHQELAAAEARMV